ncbi:sortase [Candidatus Kaiserbacteria bacterium]|nr:sortase [Candidatus Kaiserbacteria bacterium]
MKGIVDITAQLIRAGKNAYTKKGGFLSLFVVIFLGSVGTLAQFDLLPEVSSVSAAAAATDPEVMLSINIKKVVEVIELPTKIEIPTISLSTSIANPTTTTIEVLDQKLLSGAVRYPTSAKLGEVGNVVLFGHSSYLPIVGNQAYKAFNGIQKLVKGDIVTVYSSDTAYTYEVQSIKKENAASDAGINLAVTGKVLTLATCNSFGTKEDRFIVTSYFVESHSISSVR